MRLSYDGSFLLGLCNRLFFEKSSSASGLVVKSNVAIVGPRVRFPAGAGTPYKWLTPNIDTVAEWLRRLTRNQLGLSRAGSSPVSVELLLATMHTIAYNFYTEPPQMPRGTQSGQKISNIMVRSCIIE